MKKSYNTLLFLFITTISFAQGIAIQGIARDNASSAITDINLTFTFSITKNDNTVLYSETQAIKTDNFGVFSHIVSTGNPTTSAFNNVDFSITNLKMKVLVVYGGNTIEVYNQPFQYTPYAFFAEKAALATNATNADNGVPTGAVMPYTGATAPEGWVLCNGQSLTSITGAAALIAIVGNNAPRLEGLYLKGVGVDAFSTTITSIGLRGYQPSAIAKHTSTGSTSQSGNHNHSIQLGQHNRSFEGSSSGNWPYQGGTKNATLTSDAAGNHAHTVTVASGAGIETRPNSYGVNYIIKL
jgi:microcystin-dependent protein